MATFKYVMTIPSVDIKGFVAIDDLALIGSEDERYRQLQAGNPVMGKYLAAFRAPDGTHVQPSIVIRDASLPKVDARRLCSFRNAIAVSSVLYSRTEQYMMNTPMGVYCTDLFDFCPVSVSSDGTDLIGRTPFEVSGWMEVDGFAGSTTPSVIHPQHVRMVSDEWLMVWLLNLLEVKYRRRADVQFRNRIFRSIELAYYALRAPIVNLQAQVDFGVALSLWVLGLRGIGLSWDRGRALQSCEFIDYSGPMAASSPSAQDVCEHWTREEASEDQEEGEPPCAGVCPTLLQPQQVCTWQSASKGTL